MNTLYKQVITLFIGFFFLLISVSPSQAQHSVARDWNELLIETIRNDLARPTVHARNLFHTSVAMYDIWALFDPMATPYLVGQTVDGYTCTFDCFPTPTDIDVARDEAICYAMYRILRHRFISSNAAFVMFSQYDTYMSNAGYDINITSTDY